MKNLNRFIAMLLCVGMLSGMFPLNVFAEDGIDPTDENHVHCADCGKDPCACVDDEDTTEAPEICDVCDSENCETEHKQCDVCEKYDCGKTHTTCEACGTVDCTAEHIYCEACEKYDCNETHTAEPEKCSDCDAELVEGETHTCPPSCNCGEAHVDTNADCPLYIAPKTHEEGCTLNPDHDGDCVVEPKCECGAETAEHKANCPLYKVPLCPNCEAELTDDHECDCTCGMPDGVHQTGCALSHNIPLCDKCEATMVDGVLTHEDGCYYTIRCENCEKFGHTADECEACPECKQTAEEGHASNCPIALMSLANNVVGKTAFMPEGTIVYKSPNASSGSFTARYNRIITIEEVRMDSANIVWYRYSISNPFNLHPWVKSTDIFIASEEKNHQVNDTLLTIDYQQEVFPEGTLVSVIPKDDLGSEISASMSSAILNYYPESTFNIHGADIMDITFIHGNEIVQPKGSVSLSFEIPAEKIHPDSNIASVFHIDDSGNVDLISICEIDNDGSLVITAEAYSFSHYVVLQGEVKYNATLMRDILKNNKRYSIVEFPVTLNDFNASEYNKTYGSSGLWFTTGTAGTGMNLGALPATQGIVQDQLVNGYPVTAGKDRGSIIFSDDAATGKTPHSNVPFEFIYDNQTGYYTYNSGANHAQYNSNTNTVELYADTLAPYNYRTDLLLKITTTPNRDHAQQMATSPNDKTNIIAYINSNTSHYMFEITDARFPDVDTDKYTHMYLRLKATFGGDIQCRVFYTDNTYGTYTVAVQEDTWADYVFGPFDTGKDAKYVRFYVPSAKKGDSVEIDTAGVLQTDNDQQINFAGFYPFNTTLTTSYAGSEKFNMDTWEKLIWSGNNHQLYSSRVMYNKPYEDNTLDDPYAYFAMAMEVDFYIPESGKVDEKDIVFNFNGDDDMWVFVDGELALDIGGAHTDVAGSINFTSGATYVENVRSLTDTTTTGNGSVNGKLSSEQNAPGEYHKMKIFYMERAGTNSNCLIKFNLPVVPTGDVLVSKTVKETYGREINDNQEFTFTATINDQVYANKKYTVVDNANVKTTKTTDGSGKFTLKNGQTAIFDGIGEGSSVSVTEDIPSDGKYSIYNRTTVNGTNGYTASGTTTADTQLHFNFVNNYTSNIDIIIKKKVTNLYEGEDQSFIFHVKGEDKKNSYVDMDVTITLAELANGQAVIRNVPVGTYTVTEDEDWSWRYDVTTVEHAGNAVTDNSGEYTVKMSPTNNTIEFTNHRDEIYWMDGNSNCINVFGENASVSGNQFENKGSISSPQQIYAIIPDEVKKSDEEADE